MGWADAAGAAAGAAECAECFGDALTDHRYNLTFSASARNLLNSTNPGPVWGISVLPSSGNRSAWRNAFGPASGAGNRRVELGLRFNF